MESTRARADLPAVTTSAGDSSDRGSAIARRVEALGITDREWHAVTGIDRKTLNRAILNKPGTRPSTYTAIEAELDRLEARNAGEAVTSSPQEEIAPGVVRVEVQGVYGAKALVFQAPVENVDVLEQMVDRIMRRLASGQGADDPQG